MHYQNYPNHPPIEDQRHLAIRLQNALIRLMIPALVLGFFAAALIDIAPHVSAALRALTGAL